MEQSELLHFVVEALERIGLRYFVTGSMATIFFGEPASPTTLTSSWTYPLKGSLSSARPFRHRTSI